MIAAALAFALQAIPMSPTKPTPATPPAATLPPPAGRLAPAPPHGGAMLKAMGMSDAGIHVLQTAGAPDPDDKAFADRRAALRARVAALADAQPFDAAAFLAGLKDENAVEIEARNRNFDRIARTLQQLPPADRPIYAHAVTGRRGPPPASPALASPPATSK